MLVKKEEYPYKLYSLTYSIDVMERHKFKNQTELELLTKVVASSIGSLVNSNTIANTFKSEAKTETNKQKSGYLFRRFRKSLFNEKGN